MQVFLRSGLLALALLFAVATPALASGKALWYSSSAYNPVAADISGVPDMNAMFEDDWSEWQLLTGSECSTGECAIGFTDPFMTPGGVQSCNGTGCYSYITDPTVCPPVGGVCILVYHQIFLSPDETQAFFGSLPVVPGGAIQPIWDRLQDGTQDPVQAARAILTFIHESYHNRLLSTDEALVNACALRDFGYWLSRDFQIPETTTTTVTVAQQQTQTKQLAYYVRVRVTHHKRLKNGKTRTSYTYKNVRHSKTVTTTTTTQVPQQQTIPNPLYQALVADAQAFYQSQPAPYNAGTCSAAPVDASA